MLVRSPAELARTDIDPDALASLRASHIREVTILGRRGPAQAAFALKEVKELAELDGVTFTVDRVGFELPAVLPEERERRGLLDFLAAHVDAPIPDGHRIVRLRLAASPAEISGENGQVGSLRIVRNHVEADGSLVPTRVFDHLDAGLVVRAVGYRGVPPPGVPADPATGCIPNVAGRVLDAPGGTVLPGVYAAGWAKRGPSGLVGTNRACARETVEALLADVGGGPTQSASVADVDHWLAAQGCRVVDWAAWQRIDAREQALGAAEDRPRHKLATVADLLAAAAPAA
jgi:ferredoxin--NADP+ reductase